MTSMWLDDLDVEGAEYDDSDAAEYDDSEAGEFAESDYDTDYQGEDHDAESRASRRRAQRRRVALARRRQAQVRAARSRRPSVRPTRVPAKTTASAIRNLDLDSKVADDTLRRGLAAQGKRMSRSEYAAVAGAAITQFMESFDAPDNEYAKAALRFTPLLLLSPQKRGGGFEGFVQDPRVVGAAAVAGITFLGKGRKELATARKISIAAPSTVVKTTKGTFFADVRDLRERLLTENVSWGSSDDTKLKINPTTGDMEALAEGVVIVTATLPSGDFERIAVTVTK